MKRVYLLTGRPGTGKTSLIKQAVTEFHGNAGGFYTEEIRSQGSRLGFKLVTLDGQEATLAHVDSLEKVGVSALRRAAGQCELVVVDEIGKMELFSASFREAVRQIIGSSKRVLGTIMFNPNPWADAIKQLPQVNLVEVTRASYHQVLDELLDWLKSAESLKS